MQFQLPVYHGSPRIEARIVGLVEVGLQPLPALQFDVRDYKIQLQPPLVAVLYPQNSVLVALQSGQERLFKVAHQLVLGRPGQISLGKGQDARGVFLGVRTGIDQGFNHRRVAPVERCAFPVPVTAQEVANRPGAPAYPTVMEFDDHGAVPPARGL